jgi:arsenical-resistance protein 2
MSSSGSPLIRLTSFVQGGTITHSTNLPAQTLYYSIPSVYNLLQAGKVPLAIFYCGTSRGRGTRAAGWFSDYIASQATADAEDDGFKIEGVILKGGIKGWVNAGEEYQAWMTAFVPEYWTQFADLNL